MKKSPIWRVNIGDERFRQRARKQLESIGVNEIMGIGNESLLFQDTLGILCSIRCPGSIILKTHDFIKKNRDTKTVFISGFHSPMERECLNILSRGHGKAVWCLPRSIERFRLPRDLESPLEESRLAITSIFPFAFRRPTQESSMRRNMFVAAISDEILVPYASDQGRLFAFVCYLIEKGYTFKTFNDRNCEHLIRKGVLAL